MDRQINQNPTKILVTVEVFLQDYQAIQSLIQDDDPEREAIPQVISQIVRGWQAASLEHYEPVND
jgi:hypothetical protein